MRRLNCFTKKILKIPLLNEIKFLTFLGQRNFFYINIESVWKENYYFFNGTYLLEFYWGRSYQEKQLLFSITIHVFFTFLCKLFAKFEFEFTRYITILLPRFTKISKVIKGRTLFVSRRFKMMNYSSRWWTLMRTNFLKKSSNKVLLSKTYVSEKRRKKFLEAYLFKVHIFSCIKSDFISKL